MIKLALFSLFCLQAALAAPNWGLKEGLIEEYGEVRYELQYWADQTGPLKVRDLQNARATASSSAGNNKGSAQGNKSLQLQASAENTLVRGFGCLWVVGAVGVGVVLLSLSWKPLQLQLQLLPRVSVSPVMMSRKPRQLQLLQLLHQQQQRKIVPVRRKPLQLHPPQLLHHQQQQLWVVFLELMKLKLSIIKIFSSELPYIRWLL